MSVFGIVSAGKILKKTKYRVDNDIFKLHYRFTFLLFLVACLLTTAKEFVGAPIMCESRSKDVKGAILNTYCFIMSTFSIPTSYNKSIGNYVAYHGLGTPESHETERTFHAYYLWVPFVLFLQAVMFYLPHFIWKKLEGGIYETVLGGLQIPSLDAEGKKKKYKPLIKYMLSYLHTHQIWAFGFFLCECLNLINAVGNIYFIDYFLGGTFLTYGTEVVNFPEQDFGSRVDPMTRIFPKMTKCTFRKYGASGTLETHDAFCVLAVNIINEKIYIFIWFWLVFLTFITAAWLVFRIAVIVSKGIRNFLLKRRGRWAGEQNLKIIADQCYLGDWFLVYQLGSHMEPGVYGEFLKDFAKELENNTATLERKPMLMN